MIDRKHYRRSQIVKYWFSDEGQERLMKHDSRLLVSLEWDIPHCFACNRTAIDPDELKHECVKNWDHARIPIERSHIIPLALGGIDHVSNIVLLCKRCHQHNPNCNDEEMYWLWMRNTESYIITDQKHWDYTVNIFNIDINYFRDHSKDIKKIIKEISEDESFYFTPPTAFSDEYGNPPVYTGLACTLKKAISIHKQESKADFTATS